MVCDQHKFFYIGHS